MLLSAYMQIFSLKIQCTAILLDRMSLKMKVMLDICCESWHVIIDLFNLPFLIPKARDP